MREDEYRYREWASAALADCTYSPMTEREIVDAYLWTTQYGPPNCWTGTLGHAATMIRKLLREREQLLASVEYHTSGGDDEGSA